MRGDHDLTGGYPATELPGYPTFVLSLEQRIARLGSDRESGASEILGEVLDIFREALAAGAPLMPVARGVCRAQPSMAPVWNAALELLGSDRPAERLDRLVAQAAKAPAALRRVATSYFLTEGSAPLRLVTMSFSGTVAGVLEQVARTRPLRVACSESRPALEGRRLASRLAAAGIAVTFYADAAIGHAVAGADGIVLGADAVAPEWFLNKSGTRMLAAASAQQGVPVLVMATRDKFVSPLVGGRLAVREEPAAEIWEQPPAGVVVRNPYFESTPLELVTSLITDTGVLEPDGAAALCESAARAHPAALIAEI
jgi:translation initiation factor 2B subunit (eIF-2B alpha/beta/delta family)